MGNSKWKLNFLRLVVVLLAFSVVVESCHSVLHLLGKRKRRQTTNSSMVDDRTFMPSCLQRLSSRFQTWNGPVDYVILHSFWYQNTSAACSEALGTDTPECWLQSINSLLFSNSTLIDQVKQCVVEYTFEIRGTNYTGSMFPSEEMETPFDDDLCPEVTENMFLSDFSAEVSGVVLEFEDDETIADIDSVVSVMQSDLICPTCNCEELSVNIGALEEFAFSNNLECNRCWPSRMASLARQTSRLARPLGVTAVRVDNLTAVTNCPMVPSVEINDPDFVNSLGVEVECLSTGINIRAERCRLVDLGILFLDEFIIADPNRPLTPTSALDNDCSPTIFDSPDRSKVRFSIRDFTVCEPRIFLMNNQITYSYFLRIQVDDDAFRGPISRVGNYNFNFNCTYQLNYSIASDIQLLPRLETTTFTIKDNPGNFTIILTLFRDLNFTEEIMPGGPNNQRTITVPDPVFVSVDVMTSTASILLLVDRCTVSNSVPASSNASYVLVDRECPDDRTVEFINSTNQRRVRFSFDSFSWVDSELEQQIYLTCSVRICDTSTPDCERRTCSRKKRSVAMEKKTKQITAGPLLVKRNRNPCYKNNGGCSHICRSTDNFHHVCACPFGYNLVQDGKTCLENAFEKSEIIEENALNSEVLDKTTVTAYVLAILLISLMIFNAVAYLRQCKKTKKEVV